MKRLAPWRFELCEEEEHWDWGPGHATAPVHVRRHRRHLAQLGGEDPREGVGVVVYRLSVRAADGRLGTKHVAQGSIDARHGGRWWPRGGVARQRRGASRIVIQVWDPLSYLPRRALYSNKR